MKLTSLAEYVLLTLEIWWNKNSYLEKVYELTEEKTVTPL